MGGQKKIRVASNKLRRNCTFNFFFGHMYTGKIFDVPIRRFLNFNLKSIVLEWIFHNQEKDFCSVSPKSRYCASKSKNFSYGKFWRFLEIFGTKMKLKQGLWFRWLKERTKGHHTHHFEPLWSNDRLFQPLYSPKLCFFTLFPIFWGYVVEEILFSTWKSNHLSHTTE